jgi:hypothetical protein
MTEISIDALAAQTITISKFFILDPSILQMGIRTHPNTTLQLELMR